MKSWWLGTSKFVKQNSCSSPRLEFRSACSLTINIDPCCSYVVAEAQLTLQFHVSRRTSNVFWICHESTKQVFSGFVNLIYKSRNCADQVGGFGIWNFFPPSPDSLSASLRRCLPSRTLMAWASP
jgi:hypothetical protein